MMTFLVSFIVKPLAYLSLPLFVVQRIAIQPRHRDATLVLSCMLEPSTLLPHAASSSLGMTLVGQPYETNLVVARMFYTLVHRALDLQIETEGEEYLEAKPAVYMSSAYD
jgi:hypothetical protein